MTSSIGTVHVEVRPTAVGFVDEIDAKYTAEAEALGKKMGERIQKPIVDQVQKGVTEGISKADARGSAARKGKETGGAFARALKSELAATLNNLPDGKVDLDTGAALDDVARLRAEIAALLERANNIDLRVGGDEALEEVALIKAQIEALTGDQTIDIDAEFDYAKALASLDRFENEVRNTLARNQGSFADQLLGDLDGAIKALPDIKLTADSSDVDADLARIRAELETLSKNARLGIGLDDGSTLARITELRAALVALGSTTATPRVKFDVDNAITSLDGFSRAFIEKFKANEGAFANSIKSAVNQAVETLPEVRLRFQSEAFNQELQRIRSSLLDFNDIEIGVNITDAQALSRLSTLRGELLALSKDATLQVKADISDAVRGIDELAARLRATTEQGLGRFADDFATRIRALGNDLPELEIKGNDGPINEVLINVKERLQALSDRRIGIDVDAGEAIAEVTALETILRALPDDLQLNVRADVIRTIDGLRSVREEASGLPGEFDSVGDAVDAMGQQLVSAGNQGFSSMSRLKLIAIAVAAAMPLITTAIAALPAILALIAAPIAAVVVGLDGIKASAAQLIPAFQGVQAIVSATFVQSLQPAMQNVLSLMPTLSSGLSTVATSLGGMATQITAVISSGTGFADIFTNASAVIDSFAPGIATLTNNLVNLGNIGLKAFENFGPTFERVGQTWEATIQRMSDTGNLEGAITALLDILGGVTELIAPITELGASFLNTFGPGVADAIKAVADALSFLASVMTSLPNVREWDPLKMLGEAIRGDGQSIQAQFDAYRESARNAATENANLGASAQKTAADFTPLATAQQNAQTALQGYITAVQQSGAGSAEAQAALANYNTALASLNEAQAAAADSVNILNQALIEQTSQFQSILGSTTSYEQSLLRVKKANDEANQEIKKSGINSDASKAKILAQKSAIEQSAQAAGKQAAAIAKANGATDTSVASSKAYNVALTQSAAASGAAGQQVLALAGQYNQAGIDASNAAIEASGFAYRVQQIPGGKEVKVLLNPADVPKVLAQISSQVAATKPQVTPTVNEPPFVTQFKSLVADANGQVVAPQTGVQPQGLVSQFQSLIASSNQQIVTPQTGIQPQGFAAGLQTLIQSATTKPAVVPTEANPVGAVADFRALVTGAQGQTATIATAANPAGANAAINQIVAGANAKPPVLIKTDADTTAATQKVDAAVAGVAGKVGIIKIDGDPAPAGQKTDQAKAKADGTTGMMKVDANTSAAKSAIDQIVAYANSQTATITVQVKQVGGVTGATGNRYGAVYGMARGGNLTPNMSAAKATVVNPNTWRVIGDRPLGREAFIPLNNSRRSQKILEVAARAMGRMVVKPSIPMASGGVVATQQVGAFQGASIAATAPRADGRSGGGGSAPLIGTVNLTPPAGADAGEYMRELAFTLRHYRHGSLHAR